METGFSFVVTMGCGVTQAAFRLLWQEVECGYLYVIQTCNKILNGRYYPKLMCQALFYGLMGLSLSFLLSFSQCRYCY